MTEPTQFSPGDAVIINLTGQEAMVLRTTLFVDNSYECRLADDLSRRDFYYFEIHPASGPIPSEYKL